MISIDIKESTFKRLEGFAIGFDSPDAAINRLLDKVENKANKKPVLKLFPNDEEYFLKSLVRDRGAEVVLYYSDGSRKITHWNAKKITEKSNLRGNLWSGFLRGWEGKGIVSAEFSIYPREHDDYTLIDLQRDGYLVRQLGLTFREARCLDGFYEIVRHVHSTTYCTVKYSIQFFDGYDLEILREIEGLDSNSQIFIPIYEPGLYNVDCPEDVSHKTKVIN